MNDLSEDNIVNSFLALQRSENLSEADKERLDQFMDTYATARNEIIKQLKVMKVLEYNNLLKKIEEAA
jgi:hypothetical protein